MDPLSGDLARVYCRCHGVRYRFLVGGSDWVLTSHNVFPKNLLILWMWKGSWLSLFELVEVEVEVTESAWSGPKIV